MFKLFSDNKIFNQCQFTIRQKPTRPKSKLVLIMTYLLIVNLISSERELCLTGEKFSPIPFNQKEENDSRIFFFVDVLWIPPLGAG